MIRRVRVRGHRRAASNLRNLARATPAQVDLALQAAALQMENTAKARAPYLTGTLRRSITHEREDR